MGLRYLYRRGRGAKRRVMHLCGHNIMGDPTMVALCGIRMDFDTTCNYPLGQKVCGRCNSVALAVVGRERTS